jgi:hypothetical protein
VQQCALFLNADFQYFTPYFFAQNAHDCTILFLYFFNSLIFKRLNEQPHACTAARFFFIFLVSLFYIPIYSEHPAHVINSKNLRFFKNCGYFYAVQVFCYALFLPVGIHDKAVVHPVR